MSIETSASQSEDSVPSAIIATPKGGGSNRQRTRKICLLGSEGAGKTMFLAGLELLAGDPLRPLDIAIKPLDVLTARLMRQFGDDLRKDQKFPPATFVATRYRLQVILRHSTVFELDILDYPGGTLRRDYMAGHGEGNEVAMLRSQIESADLIVLLIDKKMDLNDEQGRERLNASFQALTTVMVPDAEAQQALSYTPPPVAIALTKADRYEIANGFEAGQLIRSSFGALEENLRSKGIRFEYFALSATGPGEEYNNERQAYVPPAQLAPFGYVELFHWADRQLRVIPQFKKHVFRWTLCIAVLAPLILIPVVGFGIYQKWEVGNIKVQTPGVVPPNPPWTDDGKRADIDQQLKVLDSEEHKISEARNTAVLDEISKTIKPYKSSAYEGVRDQAETLLTKIQEKKRDLEFTAVEALRGMKSSDFELKAREFVNNHPGSSRVPTIQRWLAEVQARNRTEERNVIRSLPVTNLAELRAKIEKIEKYLNKYSREDTELDIRNVQRGVALAKRFLTKNRVKLKLIMSGGFSRSGYQSVEIRMDRKDVLTTNPDQSVRDRNWDQSFECEYQWGDVFAIGLLERTLYGGYYDYTVATGVVSDFTSLRTLTQGKYKLNIHNKKYLSQCPDPYLQIECDDSVLLKQDWIAFDKFITPGLGW